MPVLYSERYPDHLFEALKKTYKTALILSQAIRSASAASLILAYSSLPRFKTESSQSLPEDEGGLGLGPSPSKIGKLSLSMDHPHSQNLQ